MRGDRRAGSRIAARSSKPSSCCASRRKRTAALTEALQDFVKARIAPYKYPRLIEYVRDLPRTATGKLQRFKLRDDGAAAR